jgi:hypothetical protein
VRSGLSGAMRLAPGESKPIIEHSLLSLCARCEQTFITRPSSIGDVAAPPTRCGKCGSRYWNVPRGGAKAKGGSR